MNSKKHQARSGTDQRNGFLLPVKWRRTSLGNALRRYWLCGAALLALTTPGFAAGGGSGLLDRYGDGTMLDGNKTGGSDQTGTGASGDDGEGAPDCCGGAGGGAGATGGRGGISASSGPGGAGGSTPGANGGNGATDTDGSGSGGGGGAHGFVGSALPTSVFKGGDGGNGGQANAAPLATGGGGGAGGYGAVVNGDGSYLAGTLSVGATGGQGGSGGDGYASARLSGGGGGSGGVGLFLENNATGPAQFSIDGAVAGGNGGNGGAFAGRGGNGGVGLNLSNVSSSAVQFTINSAVSGGNGGAAGAGGVTGTGGAGLVGSNMNVVMGASGSITGGMNGDLLTLANAITFTGGTNFLTFTNATSYLRGNIDVTGTLAFAQSVGRTNVTNSITGTGAIEKAGSATLTLSGANTYTGATTVNGGILEIQGSLTGTSSVNVNFGGALTGAGIIDSSSVTIASGGTFRPGSGTAGSFTTIEGSLAFQSGANYLVQIDPSTASYAKVIAGTTSNGTVTIDSGATVNAVFANGSYISKRYTILTTADGRTGTFAPALANTNLPAGFATSLGYDSNNVYLDLALDFVKPPGSGLNRNQQGVGSALVNFFNTNGGIAMVYGGMTPLGLTQASGEVATGAQQATFGAMGQFMGLLTDPAAGCASPTQGGIDCLPTARAPDALGYANDARTDTASPRKRAEDAFAMLTKSPSGDARDAHWSSWAMGFGGTQNTDGNAATGSSTVTSRIYGMSAGAEYRFSPNTVAGFAMGGGGTNFSVGNSGSGRSDLFQTGIYLRHADGPAYLSSALAYGWQGITTERGVSIAGIERLQAKFNANAWSGRLEGGYRIAAPWAGGVAITPYAAAQVTRLDLPSYAEQAMSGAGNFALSYAAKNVTDTRTELGLRSHKSFAVNDAVLTLRGRAAWAHNYNTDRSASAVFQALPGASFTVNGAAPQRDAALTTASAEMTFINGFSLAASFESEFSDVTQSYAGKGVVRYVW